MNKDLRRRLVELDQYVKWGIIVAKADRSTVPRNFGQYESWIIYSVILLFRRKNPDIRFLKTDMMQLISGEFNHQLKEGYKTMK